jgi:hypothetical protein
LAATLAPLLLGIDNRKKNHYIISPKRAGAVAFHQTRKQDMFITTTLFTTTDQGNRKLS